MSLSIVIFCKDERGVLVGNVIDKSKHSLIGVYSTNKLDQYKKNWRSKKINKKNICKIFNLLQKNKVDLLIVAGFRIILKKEFLETPRLGVINLHPSLLPKFRGGSPLNWQIIKGEKNMGVSFIKMNEKIDGGEILLKKKFYLKKNENIYHAHQKANTLFASHINKAIDNLLQNKLEKHNLYKGNYFQQRCDKDGLIDWNQTRKDILNFIRALTKPYNGAYTYYKNTQLRIFEAKKYNQRVEGVNGQFFKKKGLFIVICNDGPIILEKYEIKKKCKLVKGFFDNNLT